MCYDSNAQPPIPEGANGTAQGEDIVLTATDGTQFAAYSARPGTPTGPQIIIYPDPRGLHQFYKDLALRFAEIGVAAITIDYYGRSAGLTTRDDAFDFMPHIQQLQIPTFTQDVKAAQAYLRATADNGPQFILGFCMGGSLALVTGTDKSFGFAGVIAFYAGMSHNLGGQGTTLERAKDIAYPVLGLFGGVDPSIPAEQVQALDTVLAGAGVDHTIISYPGAPHSFFDRKATEFADASANAWQSIREFIAAHSS